MVGRKLLFAGLCVLAIVVGLTPSVLMNVWPALQHHQTAMAVVSFILAFGAAVTPFALKDLSWGWWCAAIGLFLVLVAVCTGNGIVSSELMQGDFLTEREDKLDAKEDWKTRIEEWKSAKAALENKYTPTDEIAVSAAQEMEATACKYPASENCKSAQANLKQVTHDFGLTKRVEKLEAAIEQARNNTRIIGKAPADHFKQAKIDADALPFNPLANRPLLVTAGCELWAAIGPKILITLIISLFLAVYGEKWWETPPPSQDSIPYPQPVRESFTPIQRVPSPQLPKKPANSMAVLVYLDGVNAWLDAAKPTPGAKNEWYAAGHVFLNYTEFCERKGYTPCKAPTVLGTLIKNHCDPRPFKKMGGRTYYEFNLPSQPKLALVQTA